MPRQIAAYTGPEAQAIIIQWVRDHGLTHDDVRILQRGETVWVETRDERTS